MGNYLRVKKAGNDVAFSFRELSGLVGDYQVVCHAAAGVDPCAASEPPIKPTPISMRGSSPPRRGWRRIWTMPKPSSG